MKTPSLGTLGSLALNVILSMWLVYQYYYDIYFRTYVDSSLAPVYPYMILTMGLGGGSGLGYLLLKRRHPEKGQVGQVQTGRSPKPAGLPSTPSSLPSMSQSKGPLLGAAQAQPSKHTVYAVPPLVRSSVSSGPRAGSSTLWSAASKQPSGSPGVSTSFQRSESNVTAPQQPSLQSSPQSFRPDQTGKATVTSPQIQRPDQSQPGVVSKLAVDPLTRAGLAPQWRPELQASPERKSEPAFVYPKPLVESVQKPEVSHLGGRPAPAEQSSTSFSVAKWAPPDTGTKPAQWTNPVPRQPAYSPPQKWAPPPGAGTSPQPRSPGVAPLRPMQPPQSRQQFPPSQGPPRPLAYPGLVRPSEPGPVQGPRPPRPDLAAESSGPGMQPRPPFQGQRPGSPQLWPGSSPASQEKGELQNASGPQGTPVSSQPDPVKPKSSENSPVGEMDWDTALDTILKTLRKDKVVEKS